MPAPAAPTTHVVAPTVTHQPVPAVTRTVVPTRTVAPPAPVTRPAPITSAAPASNCDSAYPGSCLHDGIGDYDCAGGSGNGPNYVHGPIKVLSPDPFGLDSDHDGVGCES